MEAAVREVLRTWSLAPRGVSLISAHGNTHWRVDDARGRFVLRRYRAPQSADSIAYELRVLTRLRQLGWPVATPIGQIAWSRGSAFVLFPHLSGRPVHAEDVQQRRRRGRILARLHRDCRNIEEQGQREGWKRVDQIVLEETLTAPAFQRRCSNGACAELDRSLSVHAERIGNRLCAVGCERFRTGVVHGDLIAQNLLFVRQKLTGVLDFDSVHIDLLAVDVACARRRADDEVVRGYLEIERLEPAEIEILDDLWRASILRYAVQLRRIQPESSVDRELRWCVKQLEQTRRFGAVASA